MVVVVENVDGIIWSRALDQSFRLTLRQYMSIVPPRHQLVGSSGPSIMSPIQLFGLNPEANAAPPLLKKPNPVCTGIFLAFSGK